MHGFYKANGGCGYVKKPDFLMKTGPNNEVFDPQAELPVKTTLKVLSSLMRFLYYFPLVAIDRKKWNLNEYLYRLKCTWGMVGIWTSRRHISTNIPLPISTLEYVKDFFYFFEK